MGGTTGTVERLGEQAPRPGPTGLVVIDVCGPVDRHDEVVASPGGGYVQEPDGLGILEPAVDCVSGPESGCLDAFPDADLDRPVGVDEELNTPVGPRVCG